MEVREKTVTLIDIFLPIAFGLQTSTGVRCKGFAWEIPTLPLTPQQDKEQEI